MSAVLIVLLALAGLALLGALRVVTYQRSHPMRARAVIVDPEDHTVLDASAHVERPSLTVITATD